MTLGEATPPRAALVEAVLAEGRWERLTGDQDLEDVLKRFEAGLVVAPDLGCGAQRGRSPRPCGREERPVQALKFARLSAVAPSS
jgi:hypothetical protein